MKDKELVNKIKSITKCTHNQAMDVLGLICEIKQQVHMQAAYSIQPNEGRWPHNHQINTDRAECPCNHESSKACPQCQEEKLNL